MKIVQGDELEWKRGLEYRGGMFHFRTLMEGEEGTLDNFQLSLGRMSGDFFSPRHRHNFEQVRFQVAGTLNYARDGKLTEGMVGYFPEGAPYGPQSQAPDEVPMTAVLQFGGASGGGYLSRGEVKAGMDALADSGTFEGGVFRRHKDVPGKRNLDGYQAIWEHHYKRPMTYPKPRYSRPFFMDPNAYDWVPMDSQAGVAEKPLGVFTERHTAAGFVKIDPAARYATDGRTVMLVVSGTGRLAGAPLRRFTTVLLERGEDAEVEAVTTLELLRLGLPDLSRLADNTRDGMLTAAE